MISHRASRIAHRLAVATLAMCATVGLMAAPLFTPVAQAIPVEVVANPKQDITDILDHIATQLTRAGTVALFNAAQTFLGQLAYDAANYVATGGKGQNPLISAKSPGAYLASVGEDALGSAIGSLSDEFFESELGFDLCAPPDPRTLLNIQLSLGRLIPVSSAFERPRPSCDFQQVLHNYDQFYTTLTSGDLLQNVNASFNPNSSELGATFQIFGRTIGNVGEDLARAAANRGETGPYNNVTDVISGNIKTPASLVAETTQEHLVRGPYESEGHARNAILTTAFDQGPAQLAIYTASMFVNTLGSKLMTRIMEKGLIGAFDFNDIARQSTVAAISPDALPQRSREDARRANLELKDVSLIRQSNVETLSELIACPDVRGTWNCAMDQQLAQALQGNACDGGSCTIGKALGSGLLHGDWKLFPDSMVRQNQDPQCYTYGFCAGNARKLRLLRILPVGFEFAANDPANIARCSGPSGCVTLKEVTDGFTSCNDQGKRDDAHPWCKLIDPNWVLTSFPQQCRLTGFGEQLVSARAGTRKEECSDVQTCLQRNDKGECVGGYGYCVAEKTVYRFKGDECAPQAASCRNFTTRAGTAASYLRNSVDYAACSADNVGCLGYATNRSVSGDWLRPEPYGSGLRAGETRYFDKTLETCAQSDEGCTRLLAAEVGGSSLNLIANPSFERQASAGILSVWTTAGAHAFGSAAEGTAASDGSVSVELAAGTGVPEFSQQVPAGSGRVMTLSVFARIKTAGDTPSFHVTVNQLDASGASVPAGTIATLYKSASCLSSTTDPSLGFDSESGDTPPGTDWRRYECSFLTSNTTRSVRVTLGGRRMLVDGVQLEEGQYATAFLDGTNNTLPVVHMKIAPDDFRCTGAASDPVDCNKFAKVCRQVDAGCQGYNDGTGAPEVPAILSSNDLCPTECVGYAEYRKQPSAFDLVADVNPAFSDPRDTSSSYFIASTAKQCRQEEVGCETFTNVEAASAGGEQSPSFSYLRLCEKPDATLSQTYFTWEGSEVAGYQLRTWSLISTGGAGSGPKIVARRGPDNTFKDPATCNEGLWRTGLDADCRQFYDRAGTVFYAYYSQTVISSAECKPFRLGRRASSDDCTKTGGNFNVTTGECTYNALTAESRSCRAEVAGCRGYAGAGAGSVFLAVNENFRDGRGSFSAGAPSPESLLVGDQSLRLQSGGGSSLETSVAFATAPGNLYRVSFWAKSTGAGTSMQLSLRNAADPGSAPVAVGTAVLSGDWQRFSFGLFGGYAGAATSSLRWTVTGAGTPVAFLDEVRVERVQDIAYVVSGSWTTPDQCDRTFAGVPEPQAMLGCKNYTDRFNNTVPAARFTRLCREEAIGCRGFVDTRNSDASGAQSFGLGETTTTAPADRMIYAIYDRSKLCKAENDSCRAFGKPKWSVDHASIDSYTTVYYKDDITKYGEALCRPSEQFCEEFSYQGAKDYFKDPVDKTCEYKDGLRLGPPDFAEGTYSGWFRKGTNTPCYPDNLQGGNFFALPKQEDIPYTGWVGLCQPADGECTEYRDTNDTSDPLHRSGKPYFFVDNNKLDKTGCSGNADQGGGCIVLRDTNNPVLKYSAVATDLAYRAANFRAVPPVDCDANPGSPFCGGRCQGTYTTRASGGLATVTEFSGGSCNTDADCSAAYRCTSPTGCSYSYDLTCVKPKNDANVLIKVRTDRDCSQWLGCRSAETVFDQATSQYKDVCTNLALCDKASGTSNDIFCANYVDRSPRSSTSTVNFETVMQEGKFFDVNDYTSRKVALGEKDYAGYAIPDSFQIPDQAMTRVGVDGALTTPNNQNTFARDYRLAAIVHIPVNIFVSTPPPYADVRTPSETQARNLEDAPLGRANPGLKLCQHVGSGIVGYYIESEKTAARNTGKPYYNCYLPVHRESDAYNFQNLASAFGLADPTRDPVLAQAFPEPECRANPEADSPFANAFVTSWDFSKNPPAPTNKIAGYQSAKTCEYGENCACSYKRAEYESPALTKFYGTLSGAVPAGVCSGGPRNGESCIPSTILSSAGATAGVAEGFAAANQEQSCGPAEQGGRCIAASKIELIRGVFGQCLERDTTRILGEDRSAEPCLTWNPNPILFGDKDPFHYQPTSGYLPPQNSGQYYCLSPAKLPSTISLTQLDFRRYADATPKLNPFPFLTAPRNEACDDSVSVGSGGTSFFSFPNQQCNWEVQMSNASTQGAYAGRMSMLAFDLDAVIPDDRRDTDFDFQSASIKGGPPLADATGNACQQVGGQNVRFDESALRIVDAGTGYSEYFLRMNDSTLAARLGASSPSEFDTFLSDNTISYLKFTPAIYKQNPRQGRGECSYQSSWVDNIVPTGVREQDEKQWRDEFNRNYNPFMTRGNEAILTYPTGSAPVEMDCLTADVVNPPETALPRASDPAIDPATDAPRTCNFKTWEIDYRTENQQQLFNGIFATNDSGVPTNEIARSFLELRRNPTITKCNAAKPYFGIRAVFQSYSGTEGPWRFVGLWVSACAGQSQNANRYIYMNVDVGAVSVCSELAEVQSKNSKQDAAFTDRVWKDSGFRELNTGLAYSDAAAPFSSAINLRAAGKDPLFQNGQELAGFSPLNPPTFLRSGIATYNKNVANPRDKWAFLTNLFARVYRVYRFQRMPVNRGDMACTLGPFKGTRCVPDSLSVTSGVVTEDSDAECNVDGVCKESQLTSADRSSLQVCNAASGVSVGTSCGENAEICKTASFTRSSGQVVSLVNNCIDSATSPTRFACDTRNGPNVDHGGGSVTCTHRRNNSTECPVEVSGSCSVGGAGGLNYCTGFGASDAAIRAITDGQIPCRSDSDCRFGAAQYSAGACGDASSLTRVLGRCDGWEPNPGGRLLPCGPFGISIPMMTSSPSFKPPSTSSEKDPSVMPVLTSTGVGSPWGPRSQTFGLGLPSSGEPPLPAPSGFPAATADGPPGFSPPFVSAGLNRKAWLGTFNTSSRRATMIEALAVMPGLSRRSVLSTPITTL